jgi:ABC-type amino acid transport system permease subunit
VVNSRDFSPFAIFTFVALVSYALCSALPGFGQYLERRVDPRSRRPRREWAW